MFVPNLRTFSVGALEATHSKEWDGQQTQPNLSESRAYGAGR